MYLKSITGVEGEVTIPSIGATIGTTQKWALSRRDDRSGSEGIYTFQVAFSYLNVNLFREESLRKEIRVRVNRDGKWYRVERVEGSPTQIISDNQIIFEEVTLWPIED